MSVQGIAVEINVITHVQARRIQFCTIPIFHHQVTGHVAERCLNHKLEGVEGGYNRSDYIDDRRNALISLANKLKHVIN